MTTPIQQVTQNRRRNPRLIFVFATFAGILVAAPVFSAQLQPAGNAGTFGRNQAGGLSGNTFVSQAKTAVKRKPVERKQKQLAEGQELFWRNWLKKGKYNKAGDGLGPMYNAASCVACHTRGGAGGSGEAEHNVDLISFYSRNRRLFRPPAISQGQKNRAGNTVHPGLRVRTSLTLHRFVNDTFNDNREHESRYEEFRAQLLTRPKKSARWQFTKTVAGVPIEITQRNTPALFGAGIIDRVPDSAFLEVATRQRKQFPGITGRIPQALNGAIGRFGWRGQTATLHDFVIGACANELGLHVPGAPQPAKLDYNIKTRQWKLLPLPGSESRHLDLTAEQCKSLTAFIANLPTPQRARKLSLTIARDVYAGEKLFHSVGCAACHLPNMGPAKGIYSDLLLHDMGQRLADPLPATPEINEKTAPGFTGLSGYYGSEALPRFAKVTTHVRQEWRTPPLWGVADSAPYLHDGRAATLHEAISWHSGEGHMSAKNFRSLKWADKNRLVMFLQSLVAPGSATIPTPPFSGDGSVGFFSIEQ